MAELHRVLQFVNAEKPGCPHTSELFSMQKISLKYRIILGSISNRVVDLQYPGFCYFAEASRADYL